MILVIIAHCCPCIGTIHQDKLLMFVFSCCDRYRILKLDLPMQMAPAICVRNGDDASWLQAFKDMVQRCKKVGVDIYVDAVINHVAEGPDTLWTGCAM